MGPEEKVGAESERRFFAACNERTRRTPDWFIKVAQADVAWDVRGIDGFAFFRPLDGGKRIKVPIQIKSSKRGRKEFLKKMPSSFASNVTVVVVLRWKSDEQLRQQLYAKLGSIRNQRITFHYFLAETMGKPLSSQARRNYGRVRRLRKVEAETE